MQKIIDNEQNKIITNVRAMTYKELLRFVDYHGELMKLYDVRRFALEEVAIEIIFRQNNL